MTKFGNFKLLLRIYRINIFEVHRKLDNKNECNVIMILVTKIDTIFKIYAGMFETLN